MAPFPETWRLNTRGAVSNAATISAPAVPGIAYVIDEIIGITTNWTAGVADAIDVTLTTTDGKYNSTIGFGWLALGSAAGSTAESDWAGPLTLPPNVGFTVNIPAQAGFFNVLSVIGHCV